MIGKLSLAVPIAALLMAAAQPAAAYERLPASLARLSPADFARQVRVVDNPREPKVILSTFEGYTRSRALKGARADDVHLRALVDRRTGRVSWQVWHDLVYVGGPRDLTTMQYRADGGVRQSKAVIVEHGVEGCPPTDGVGSCNQMLRVAFELPERTVREIAAAYRPGARDPWRVRFKDASGRDVIGGLAPAEAAGLLSAVEAWQRGRNG